MRAFLTLSIFIAGCSSSLEQREMYILDKQSNKSIYYLTPKKSGENFKKIRDGKLLEPLDNKQKSLYCVTPETYQYFIDEASGYECKPKGQK